MMRLGSDVATQHPAHGPGHWLLICVSAVILCSCRGVDSRLASGPQNALSPSAALASPAPPSAPPAAPSSLLADRKENVQHASVTQSLSDQRQQVSTSPPGGSAVLQANHGAPVVPAVLPADGAMLMQPPPAGAARTMVQVTPMPTDPAYPPGTMIQPPLPAYGQYAPSPYPPPYCVAPAYGPACHPQPMHGPSCPCGVPCGPWTPPGLPCPWPEDEYLCDGGDKIPTVQVNKDWTVDGLELEDTVVHYDTLEGDTYVEPSNRVCLYAPRFASVRKVYGLQQHDYLDRIAGVDLPVPIEGLGDVQIATTKVQPIQPGLNLGTTSASIFRERTPLIGLDNQQGLVGTHGSVIPYEDFTEIRRAMLDNSEKARLTELVQAAIAWSHDAAVQVVIDNIATHEDVSVAAAQEIHTYSLEGKSRLQVCKMASRREARPGELVEFTLQFENVGDQVIGNVTVIDNLTTRLEYVEDSQSCSLKANFSVSPNQGESLTLRWEITEPMKVAQGGVIRFTCRVR